MGLRLEWGGISEVFPTSVALWHPGAASYSSAPSTAAQCRVTQPHGQQWELLCSTSAQREQSSVAARSAHLAGVGVHAVGLQGLRLP